MKINRTVAALAGLGLAVLFAHADLANAAEIKVWTARAIATVLAEIGSQFERATDHNIDVFSGLPADFLRRANAGEPFDILISGAGPVDSWIKDGKLSGATRTDIARSGIGVEVRAGARKPDHPAGNFKQRSRPSQALFRVFFVF